MTRGARVLSWLLVLAIALQGSLAAAHCLRGIAQGSPAPLLIEICTHEGGTAVVPVPGDPAPPGEDRADHGSCLACQAIAQILPPAPPALAARLPARAEPPGARRPAAVPPGARAPPYRPTGPPALS